MKKLGYIDEDESFQNSFYHFFKDDFSVKIFDLTEETILDELINEVYTSKLDMLIVDYNLVETGIVTFNGNVIIDKIKEKLPSLPLMILTSDESDALNHVSDGLIVYSKDEYHNNDQIFKKKVLNAIVDYQDKIEKNKEIVKSLTDKKSENGGELTLDEEEKLFSAYIYLNKVYPEDKTFSEYLTRPSEISALIDILDKSSKFIQYINLRNN